MRELTKLQFSMSDSRSASAQSIRAANIGGKVHKAVVKVLAAEMCVSRCGLDLKDALINCQKRHIKGPSAQIEDQHLHLKVITSK